MKKAIIYVRGNNEEMQEIFCRLYANDMGYNVMFITTNIDDVNLCDVMIVTNVSRISRGCFEYHEIVKKLKGKGIEVECAIDHENADEFLSFTMDIMK